MESLAIRRPAARRLRRLGALAATGAVLFMAGCTATPEQTATAQLANADAPASTTANAPGAGHASAAPISTGSIRPAQSAAVAAKPVATAPSTFDVEQRCAQLRHEGVVWERARKLAVANRGEAGGRMADAYSPWTTENVGFYLASCTGKAAAKPRDQANRPVAVSTSPQFDNSSRSPAKPSDR